MLAPSCAGPHPNRRSSKPWGEHTSPRQNDRPDGAAAPVAGRQSNGELLLNPIVEYIEFGLVALLGFLPLIVIHWSDWQRRRNHPPAPPRRKLWQTAAAETSLLVALGNWLSNFWL